ncbi:Probable low-specificity L-threonine aldolase 1 [Striga hermonthica]|uniref:Probable low-specificity L-threonine aldolase 1 n=1 Tax=Striga hermonthica TaxID=68872 RepID=A0A9N7NAE5_STRHE|nr:Probable low-specificity L-threonine aldolase 1 [Striga hermonthica]
MRAAMASAEVDDDVLGNDPTAARLEKRMAGIMGKEAALFVPSGTMANLICVLTHCQMRGSEVILGDYSHIHIYENGGISTIGGVHPRTVENNDDGTMDIDLIEGAIRDPSFEICYPTTRLICLENSHAHSGGRCLSAEYTDRVGELAKKYGLKLHIDGARIFNASVALGVPVHRLAQAADSVTACLSKGLGAPAGTIIAGSETFIAKFAAAGSRLNRCFWATKVVREWSTANWGHRSRPCKRRSSSHTEFTGDVSESRKPYGGGVGGRQYTYEHGGCGRRCGCDCGCPFAGVAELMVVGGVCSL